MTDKSIIELPFDPSASRSFKSSCVFDAEHKGHLYHQESLTEHSFTYTELISIELYDLITAFNVSTDCHAQLVHLMNTLIRDRKKLDEGITMLKNTNYICTAINLYQNIISIRPQNFEC